MYAAGRLARFLGQSRTLAFLRAHAKEPIESIAAFRYRYPGSRHRVRGSGVGRWTCAKPGCTPDAVYDCSHLWPLRDLRVSRAPGHGEGGTGFCIKTAGSASVADAARSSRIVLFHRLAQASRLAGQVLLDSYDGRRRNMNNSALLNPTPGSVRRVEERNLCQDLRVVYNAIENNGRYFHVWRTGKYMFPCDQVRPLSVVSNLLSANPGVAGGASKE